MWSRYQNDAAETQDLIGEKGTAILSPVGLREENRTGWTVEQGPFPRWVAGCDSNLEGATGRVHREMAMNTANGPVVQQLECAVLQRRQSGGCGARKCHAHWHRWGAGQGAAEYCHAAETVQGLHVLGDAGNDLRHRRAGPAEKVERATTRACRHETVVAETDAACNRAAQDTALTHRTQA
eukprot:Colp12_sorted_trinity150504_noHs@31790